MWIFERSPVPRKDLVAQSAGDLRKEAVDITVGELARRELFMPARFHGLNDLDVRFLVLRELGDRETRARRVPRFILEVVAEPRRLEAASMPRVDLVPQNSKLVERHAAKQRIGERRLLPVVEVFLQNPDVVPFVVFLVGLLV